ncbi:MYND finger [Aspergillus parasiticus SU-1]|uniref:MYND finger n=1 Tax=Aspergillus parasiticus (strain ATCC 56775 / NRRL 5862 / SRRC 143 / SU-1) TaxID=1403190 RepID=A0A0F0I4Q5_ASPPU|nr:MYND finger [Aspergillus parasiticus SU-1]
MSDNTAVACKVCAKESSSDITLKRCAKCKTQWYCSRECQKADWKTHKKTCGKNADETFANTTSTGGTRPQNLEIFIEKPFHQLYSKRWLHDRPEKDVYKLLIDTYRMKMEDQYTIEGEVDEDSIYSGRPDSRDGFRRFLRLVEKKRGLLPSWWSPEKAKACMAYGLNKDNWSSLDCCAKKSDFIEHYGDSTFPMQMRMFGEQIYGRGPGGQPGFQMMQMMMQAEKGEIQTSLLNMHR